jgi:hypothetical protein
MNDKIRRVDFYPVDWTDGIAGLDLGAAAVGVYWQLCAFCYSAGRATLPEDETIRRLAKLLGDNPRTIRAAIERLVEAGKVRRTEAETDANGPRMLRELEPNRVRTELERATNRVRIARENGTNGGRPSKSSNGLGEPKPFRDEKLAASKQQTANSSQQAAATPPTTTPTASTPAAPRSPGQDKAFEDRVLEVAKLDPARWVGNFGMVRAWRNAGCTDDDILAGISTVADRPGYRPPGSLNYFRQAIEEARDMRRAAEARGEAPPMSPVRTADVRAARLEKLTAAHAKAKAAGITPADAGFPRAEDFGLFRGPNGFEVMPGWKGPQSSQEAAA